uniref:Uncharacterized protein n=1 Tax=Globodera rostochiensis TaxID=31243 RepID=A0A914HQE2_GLORO
MFLPILLFNVLLVLSESAPWQQKKASFVIKDDEMFKCRDGREGIQIEDAKDLNMWERILIALIIEEAMEKCPNELLPFIEHCNADGKYDESFCILIGLLVRIDADEDKCAEKSEAVDFYANDQRQFNEREQQLNHFLEQFVEERNKKFEDQNEPDRRKGELSANIVEEYQKQQQVEIDGKIGENENSAAISTPGQWKELSDKALEVQMEEWKSLAKFELENKALRAELAHQKLLNAYMVLQTKMEEYQNKQQQADDLIEKLKDTANLFVSSAVDLFPCISLGSSGTKIEANFGPNFQFNIADGI